MPSNILTYALVTCGIVIVGSMLTIWSQSAKIDTLRLEKALQSANIGTLLATLERQNGEIAELGAISAQNLKASQEALGEALAGTADLEATVAALLARPVPADPGEACVAADGYILEAYQ